MLGGASEAHHRRRWAYLAALGASLFPTTSAAELPSPNLGVFLGISVGTRPQFEFGIETVQILKADGAGCGDFHGPTPGLTLQLSLLGLTQPRITLGTLLAAELHRNGPTAIGEMGVSLLVREDRLPVSLHTGAVLEAQYANLYLRQDWLLRQYGFGAGARLNRTFDVREACDNSVPGRPMRDETGNAVAFDSLASADCPLGDDASRWLADAQGECASIPAFLTLALELSRLGAPAVLVRQALDAAEDEVLHAHLCATVASALAGKRLLPQMPSPVLRPALPRDREIARLATESFLDGCLGEGFAAAKARASARQASSPYLAAVHSRIARDESRHAQLAWDVLNFCLTTGGPPTAQALRNCLDSCRNSQDASLLGHHQRLARTRLSQMLGLVA